MGVPAASSQLHHEGAYPEAGAQQADQVEPCADLHLPRGLEHLSPPSQQRKVLASWAIHHRLLPWAFDLGRTVGLSGGH